MRYITSIRVERKKKHTSPLPFEDSSSSLHLQQQQSSSVVAINKDCAENSMGAYNSAPMLPKLDHSLLQRPVTGKTSSGSGSGSRKSRQERSAQESQHSILNNRSL